MNNARRKQIQELVDRLAEVHSDLEGILSDEESYRDNIPENLQSSERYEQSEAACSNLEDAVSTLEDVISTLADTAE